MIGFVVGVFAIAGMIKGTIGLGLPAVSMGLLSLVISPFQAATLLIIPSMVTNIWQLFAEGHVWKLVRRFYPLLLGIIIGSIIAFYLARQYGQQFVKSMVSENTYNRYINWLDKGKWFDYFFAFMMFFPVSPDDFLCMLAGLTKMTYKKFIIIILVFKPFTLAAYTIGLRFIIDWFWAFFK